MILKKEIQIWILIRERHSVIFPAITSVQCALPARMNSSVSTDGQADIQAEPQAFKGILLITSIRRSQNIVAVMISIFSSGVWAPLIVGPKEIMSIPLNFS